MLAEITHIYKLGEQLTAQQVNDGVLFLVDKPLNWTSFDVVNKLRYKLKHTFGLKKVKVGHAGTLDPLATGLLLVCAGKYTKSIDQLVSESKQYITTIKLGATTATYDAEVEEENHTSLHNISNEQILNVVSKFVGKIDQVPPIYSAIKVDGQTAYSLARRGKDIELAARPIEILSIECNDISLPHISLDIHCSKGTYIRSLAHDIGQKLEVGGYLTQLRRTAIGDYHINGAVDIEVLADAIGRIVIEQS